MINKLVMVSSPNTKVVEPIHIENVLIIKVPSEAQCIIANVDCEEINWENGKLTRIGDIDKLNNIDWRETNE